MDAENIFTIIVIALIVYTAVKILKVIKNKVTKHFGLTKNTPKTNPTITLKIYNGHNNHTIPLLTLPYEWDNIQRDQIPALEHIDPLTCPQPRINMTWSGPISFKVRSKQVTYYLPNSIILPFRARFTIIKALKDPTTTAALILTSKNMLISLPPMNADMNDDIIKGSLKEPLIKKPINLTNAELYAAVQPRNIEIGCEN
jgi:hypothetical protein